MASILSSNNLRIVAENSELLIRVYRFSGSKKHLDLLGGGLGMSVSIRSFAIERFHVTSQSHENHTGGHFGVQLNGDFVCSVEVGDTRQRRFDTILSINMVYRYDTIPINTASLP